MLTDKNQPSSNLNIWGGIECTINRVGDIYYDQLDFSGHYQRIDDIGKIADLGISKLRYPVLWEKHEKESRKPIDWSWTMCQLQKIKSHGIDPIVTLLHHGSGPSFTNLLDENFPQLLASFAGKVAARFPWVGNYTPVNEPLTTARFSGLYGFWYPHKNNDISFVKMLLNQLKGVVLSMREIRKVNPSAKLIQTEDLGKTYSKPCLEYQAQFENHRRWLTFDLLTGKVVPEHPMWQYFIRLGINEREIAFFMENPCPPDILGLNYYVTSERFLDDDLQKFDPQTHGSNELQTYADIEAVRVPHNLNTGLKTLMEEAWSKYTTVLAITECHINCSREEQLRWINEMWEDCKAVSKNGVPVAGLTIWSLLGAHGWNRLLITEEKDYEVGAFDVRSGDLRPTAIAELIKQITNTDTKLHPVVSVPGWWKRNIRFLSSFGIQDIPLSELNIPPHPPVLILGKTGTLGKALARACAFRKINYHLLGRDELDITSPSQIKKIIEQYNPWAIINAAGYVRVDDAEEDADNCFQVNAFALNALSSSCKTCGIQFLTYSTDLVFDGLKGKFYTESDFPNPINIYGKSKYLSEKISSFNNEQSLIIRTSAFFSPSDKFNFVYDVTKALSENKKYFAAHNIKISPTYVPDLANASLDLLIDKASGIWHLTCGEEWSWADLANCIAESTGLNHSLVVPVHSDVFNFKARRPEYSVLGTEKGIKLQGFEDGLRRCVEEELHKLKMQNRPVN